MTALSQNSKLDMRTLVSTQLESSFAVAVLVSILDHDLDRLAAINGIMTRMSAENAQATLVELNSAARRLTLRGEDNDQLWFGFDPLPLGSHRSRPGTLAIYAGEDCDKPRCCQTHYALFAGARHAGSSERNNEALQFLDGASAVVDAALALENIARIIRANARIEEE